MNPSNKTGKLSHLIRAGAIVHTVGGGVYRCTSKIASSEGIQFRLANLQGKSVPTPADFRPISLGLARFAAWMHLAYNKDFDLYVKEYIKAAGLPVDSAMNWSKFFAAKIAPKLMSRDEEIQDEAIHHIIILTLVERGALANFQEAIKKFPQRIQELPLEKQVTTFLIQTFTWRIQEANDFIKSDIFQDQTNSMWADGDEEGEEVNLLDNVEYNNGRPAEYDAVDSDVDVATFRKGFAAFLDDKFREDTMNQYLSLFDLLYAHLREGDIPRGADIYAEWKEGMGVGKSNSWFKVLFANLPKVIDTYITERGDKEVSPFIEVMRELGKSQKEKEPELQPVTGGLKLAEQYPINQNVEPDAPDSGSQGGGGGFMPSLPEAGSEAASLGGELAEIAPLAIAASKQWEVPKCKACGKGGDRECLACHDKFCGDCILNHHANNPSHDRVTASKKAVLGETTNGNDDQPLYVDAPEQHIGLTPPEMQDFIADCVGSGLYESSPETYFTHDGCDYCDQGGCEVHDCKGYRNLTDAQAPNREELEYEFKLCDDCLYKLVYGEEGI